MTMCGADFETNIMFVKRYSKKGGLLLLLTIYRFCVFEVFKLIYVASCKVYLGII